jgi:hypothetical protein
VTLDKGIALMLKARSRRSRVQRPV